MKKGEYRVFDIKNPQAKSNFHKYCIKCGHTMTFYHFENDKKICSYCGTLNYRNNLIEFKDKIKKEMRKINYG
jgi:ribosomal protein L37E